MKTSDNGINLIIGDEGFRPVPYNDMNGNATIAYGHKLHDGPVKPADWSQYGKGITIDQGRAFLAADIAWAEKEVSSVVKVSLTQNQFDALVSFTYNVGSGTLEKSSVLKYLNQNEFTEACAVMLEYDHANGKVVPGLLTRREQEVALFEQE